MGEDENLCTGIAQSGITISTWRDLTLEDLLEDLLLGKGKPERLGRLLEMMVDVGEELNSVLVQGLSGATT